MEKKEEKQKENYVLAVHTQRFLSAWEGADADKGGWRSTIAE